MATKKKAAKKKTAPKPRKKRAPKVETPKQVEDRLTLEKLTADLGHMLGDALKEIAPNLGFALLMFDYGNDGALAYVSSAQREDMINTLDEFRDMLITDMQEPKVQN